MKRFWIAVLAVTMLATMAAPAFAVDGAQVRAATQAKVGGQDLENPVQARVQEQVQAGDCDQVCTETCDGAQVQSQFQQGQSEEKPEGYQYAGTKEPGAGAGHHFSHKHAHGFGSAEEAAE